MGLLRNLGILLLACPLLAQSNRGELRLKVTDPHGLGVKTAIELICEVNEYRNTLVTDEAGVVVARRLPFGLYRVQIAQAGFAAVSVPLEIRSAARLEHAIKLSLGGG